MKSKYSLINTMLTLGTLMLLLVVSRPADAQILSTQIFTAPPVTSSQFVDIPGLFLTLPLKSATQTFALVILNVPAPYASGNNLPGVNFAINVMGTAVAEGGFTYSERIPQSFGRMPTTIVARVPLTTAYQTVWARWISVRNSVGHIDSFASLSAVIGN
jgi:hypothetical protein